MYLLQFARTSTYAYILVLDEHLLVQLHNANHFYRSIETLREPTRPFSCLPPLLAAALPSDSACSIDRKVLSVTTIFNEAIPRAAIGLLCLPIPLFRCPFTLCSRCDQSLAQVVWP